MEADFCPLMPQEAKLQFDFDLASSNQDLGYYSACSSLSPASSVDSACFSPPFCQFRGGFGQPQEPEWTSQAWEKPTGAQIRRRTRSKNPGKKRQSASEREKLRMRDLTKALHHLRGFLPPSVAPAGQTLTKIETLHLTIHYISSLSSQLGLGENHSHSGDVQRNPATIPVQDGEISNLWSQTAAPQNLQPPLSFTTSHQQRNTSTFSSEFYRETQFPQFSSYSSHAPPHCDLADLL